MRKYNYLKHLLINIVKKNMHFKTTIATLFDKSYLMNISHVSKHKSVYFHRDKQT